MTSNSTQPRIQTLDTAYALQGKPPLMLPPRKCAEALGLSEYTVRQWLKAGYIKGVPCGKKTLLNVEAIRRKLEEV